MSVEFLLEVLAIDSFARRERPGTNGPALRIHRGDVGGSPDLRPRDERSAAIGGLRVSLRGRGQAEECCDSGYREQPDAVHRSWILQLQIHGRLRLSFTVAPREYLSARRRCSQGYVWATEPPNDPPAMPIAWHCACQA